MNHKKPVSEPAALARAVGELRSEQPSDQAVDRAVFAMQSPPLPQAPKRNPWVLRAGTAAIAAVALMLVLSVTSQKAVASDLKDVSQAVQARSVRYTKTFRPIDGELKLTNELWIAGEKYLLKMTDGNGTNVVLFDGKRTYIHYPPALPVVDDTKSSSYPVEDIDTYLRIPNAKVERVVKVAVDGRELDKYRISFPAMVFDLFVEPSSRLPVRRDVLTGGKLLERDYYEYPSKFPANQFDIPKSEPGATDYPALRKLLDERLHQPGETKEVNGVKISLKAVIVGRYEVLALWTGGAPGDYVKEGSMWVVGKSRKTAGPRPDPFTVAAPVPLNETKEPIFIEGKPLLGDAAWLDKGVTVKAPFVINVVAWQEDRSRPNISTEGKNLGFRSKPAGRLQFTVTDPIYAADPERLMWKSSYEGVKTATAVKK